MKKHLKCGGTLIYVFLTGSTGYQCDRCGAVLKKHPKKGSIKKSAPLLTRKLVDWV